MNKQKYEIVTDYNPSFDDKQVVIDGINTFNDNILNDKVKSFSVFLKDESNHVRGGVFGWLHSEAVYITTLWLEEDLRTQGFGTKLLLTAEAEAIKYGCQYSILDTYSFQAEDFYLKNGYERMAEIENYLFRHSKIFLKKKLL